MSSRFSVGMFAAIGLVLFVFTAGWVAGFVELMRHMESLRDNVFDAATAILVISGIVIFFSWWCWFICFFDFALDDDLRVRSPVMFASLGFAIALFTGAWFAGFLTAIRFLEAGSGPLAGASVGLGFCGVSILICWLVWLFMAFVNLGEQNSGTIK